MSGRPFGLCSPETRGGLVVKIKSGDLLNGQVGTVVFKRGVGETDDPRMLAYFAERPEKFTVVDDEPEQDPESPASAWAELSDDELFDAYVTNVGGDAEDRDDMIAALEALDSED